MSTPHSSAFAPTHRVRAYGQQASDLDIAFGAGRAEAVTALLDRCVCNASGAACGADAIWCWSISERLQALLAVRLATTSDPTLEVQAHCVQCGDGMDIPLDLAAFVRTAPLPSFRFRSASGDEIELRLPQGKDLLSWQHQGIPAASELVATLAVAHFDAQMLATEGTLAAIEAAFEEHDSLSALHLHTMCPECACENTIDCDLEALLLAGFARLQSQLIDEVAQIASKFHWSEAQILALPPWRRGEYLRRLDAGAWL